MLKAIIQKSTNNKCWRGCGEKAARLHCWWECKLGQPLQKTVWRVLKKKKKDLLYVPAIQPLGIYPDKTVIQKDTRTPMFTSSATSNSQERETTCVHWQKNGKRRRAIGTSLVIQWWRLYIPNAGSPDSIPGQLTRSHMLQPRVSMPQLKRMCTPQEDRRSHRPQLRLSSAK